MYQVTHEYGYKGKGGNAMHKSAYRCQNRTITPRFFAFILAHLNPDAAFSTN